MPIFYFHLHNDEDVRDAEGQEFTDLDEARAHAELQTRIFIGESVKELGRIDLQHYLDIEDEDGKVLERVSFGDVVTVKA